jgi:hypothetical protein
MFDFKRLHLLLVSCGFSLLVPTIVFRICLFTKTRIQDTALLSSSTTETSVVRHARSDGNATGSTKSVSRDFSTSQQNLRSASKSKPIILYKGNASSWQALSDNDLSIYLTPAEISGIESQNCGDVKNESSPWQWQGNIQGELHMSSGPCCPNGHAYGWFSKALQDTTPLRKIEVTSDGRKVGPFQIQALLAALHQKQRHLQQHQENVTVNLTSNTNQPPFNTTSAVTYHIWILGDSTRNQLFFGFPCAIIRIRGAVVLCQLNEQSHYSHPLCQLTPMPNKEDLSTTTADNVNRQYVSLILPDGRHIELHHFADSNFCYMDPQRPSCVAQDARFLNLAGTLSPPDLFLVNLGLHKLNKDSLEKAMQEMLALLSPFLKSVVWRSTSISHFPDTNSTGNYEKYEGDRSAGRANATACRNNINEKSQWRQQVAHEWLEKNYGGNEMANQTKIPILNMNETEMHMFETYGGPQDNGKLDCVHHIYTPLYYDSFFWRLSQLLLLEEQQRKTPPNRNTAGIF